MLGASILVLLILLVLCIPILIGVYVYKDASKRGMNAVLWTIVAIFAPSLVGLIIYLLVRGSYSNLRCPNCDSIVREEYSACPNCGTKLKTTCIQCGMPLEADWRVCPRCSQPIVDTNDTVSTPVKIKDQGLKKILVAILLIPAVLLVMMIFGFTTFRSVTSTTNTISFSAAENKNQEIQQWIDECNADKSKVYALRYMKERDGRKVTSYLIYRPMDFYDTSLITGDRGWLFGHRLEVQFKDGEVSSEEPNPLTNVTYEGDYYLKKLVVTVNGAKKKVRITDVDYNPSLFMIHTEYGY